MNGLDYIIGQIDDSIETFYESDIKSYGICRQEQKEIVTGKQSLLLSLE